LCDKDGCDFNPYRLGDRYFFGRGANYTIDTTRKFTVVMQFVTSDSTVDGDLTEFGFRTVLLPYKVIKNNSISIDGKQYSSITDDYSTAQKLHFKILIIIKSGVAINPWEKH